MTFRGVCGAEANARASAAAILRSLRSSSASAGFTQSKSRKSTHMSRTTAFLRIISCRKKGCVPVHGPVECSVPRPPRIKARPRSKRLEVLRGRRSKVVDVVVGAKMKAAPRESHLGGGRSAERRARRRKKEAASKIPAFVRERTSTEAYKRCRSSTPLVASPDLQEFISHSSTRTRVLIMTVIILETPEFDSQ